MGSRFWVLQREGVGHLQCEKQCVPFGGYARCRASRDGLRGIDRADHQREHALFPFPATFRTSGLVPRSVDCRVGERALLAPGERERPAGRFRYPATTLLYDRTLSAECQ